MDIILNEVNSELLKEAIYHGAIKDYWVYIRLITRILNQEEITEEDKKILTITQKDIKNILKFLTSGKYQFDVSVGKILKDNLVEKTQTKYPFAYSYIYERIDIDGILNKKIDT